MISGDRIVRFAFPLPRPLAGVCLGNGVQGLLVWGDETLNITVARAGFWDRRGGNRAVDACTYEELRGWLESCDHDGVEQAFSLPDKGQSVPGRPPC